MSFHHNEKHSSIEEYASFCSLKTITFLIIQWNEKISMKSNHLVAFFVIPKMTVFGSYLFLIITKVLQRVVVDTQDKASLNFTRDVNNGTHSV